VYKAKGSYGICAQVVVLTNISPVDIETNQEDVGVADVTTSSPLGEEDVANEHCMNAAESSASEYDQVEEVMSFEEMGLPETLLRGVYSCGWETPSRIQRLAILPARLGQDMLLHSQTGTGKTGAFVTSLLARLDPSLNETQALILAPVRELAAQTCSVARRVGQFLGIRCHASVGGRSVAADEASLRTKPHVVSGTPGRVLAHLQSGLLNTDHMVTFVLDEVDKLMEGGFIDTVQEIFREMPGDTQVLLVAATVDDAVQEMANEMMLCPVKVTVPIEEVALEAISQFYVDCCMEHFKYDTITDLYEQLSIAKSIVFCNEIDTAYTLAKRLDDDNYSVSVLAGAMSQRDRELVLNDFKRGSSRVLIATDVAARGIDVTDVSLVLNYDLPHDRSNYIHRIGRSGRYGSRSVAINLVCGRDMWTQERLEEHYSIRIPELPIDFMKYR